jgi:hypothetical protein
LGGGDVFRRELGGEPTRFSVYGLWGSGNVVTERDLLPTNTQTAYTMWDGHALFGPSTESLEKVPILIDDYAFSEFLDRYAFLSGDDCLVWTGEETLGLDCDVACDHFTDVCGEQEGASCRKECTTWPRAISDCISTITTCDQEAFCNRDKWALLQQTTTTP